MVRELSSGKALRHLRLSLLLILNSCASICDFTRRFIKSVNIDVKHLKTARATPTVSAMVSHWSRWLLKRRERFHVQELSKY
eukprot:9472470-Pyramimonas_sp.AAC.1